MRIDNGQVEYLNTHEQAAYRFMDSNPGIYDEFCKLAEQMRARREKYSSVAIWNVLRWHRDLEAPPREPEDEGFSVEEEKSDYFLNNDFIPYVARRYAADYDSWSFIEIRKVENNPWFEPLLSAPELIQDLAAAGVIEVGHVLDAGGVPQGAREIKQERSAARAKAKAKAKKAAEPKIIRIAVPVEPSPLGGVEYEIEDNPRVVETFTYPFGTIVVEEADGLFTMTPAFVPPYDYVEGHTFEQADVDEHGGIAQVVGVCIQQDYKKRFNPLPF